MIELTDAKRRILDRLQRVDSATATELAGEFGLTDTAVRQHLDAMLDSGLVRRAEGQAEGRGRPAARWRLAAHAADVFADGGTELSLDLLDSIRTTLGPDALAQVVDGRSRRQIGEYRDLVGVGAVAVRVRRLADRRSLEGYVAEVRVDGDDLLLVEHHCPICPAATACAELCTAELEVFREALGADVTVVREQHLLSGDQRCSYRISRR